MLTTQQRAVKIAAVLKEVAEASAVVRGDILGRLKREHARVSEYASHDRHRLYTVAGVLSASVACDLHGLHEIRSNTLEGGCVLADSMKTRPGCYGMFTTKTPQSSTWKTCSKRLKAGTLAS